MLLVIDIGNSNLVLGLFEGKILRHSWRVGSKRDQTPDEISVLLRNLFELSRVPHSSVRDVVIASVVPPLNESMTLAIQAYFEKTPVFVEPAMQNLIPIHYQPAGDVGADRIVNAVAAFEMFGGPVVIVDFGTATTFDAVSSAGEYMGGNIAPGIGISSEALFSKAAKLPRIEIKEPAEVIGTSTVSSMQAGIYYGYAGLVEGILKRMKAVMGPETTVVATGGLARLIGQEAGGVDRIEESLTLHGLRIFHQRTIPQ
ncbi:MAG TPA: type III pantothenate kinase [Acidobacteriota bacterium]|nr:type III pantothenate kinase [Acidobacteriota bacterium]